MSGAPGHADNRGESAVLLEVLACARRAADPRLMVRAAMGEFPELADRPIHLLSVGKAGSLMAADVLDFQREVDDAVGAWGPSGRIVDGVVTCPESHADEAALGRMAGAMRVFACDHPLPTQRNVRAARHVLAWVGSIPKRDALVVLLSGGASAHLTLPVEPLVRDEGITLEDMVTVTRALQRRGATIRELNCVRKHVERCKGGRLGRACGAGLVRVLVLSDVVGDPLDVIASGPFAPDPTTFAEACRVLRERECDGLAPRITRYLARGAAGEAPETPKTSGEVHGDCHHLVFASNAMVVQEVREFLRSRGWLVEGRAGVEGAVDAVAARVVENLGAFVRAGARDGVAIVFGGEWTVDASGTSGVGGPSQELALALTLRLAERAGGEGWSFGVLAYSSDGIDGPTDAAGALIGSEVIGALAQSDARRRELGAALARHDSHSALDSLGVLIRTGATGTNVNHVVVVMARKNVGGI